MNPSPPEEIEQRDHALARIKIREQIVEAMNAQEYTDAGTAERVVLRFMAAPTDVNWGGKVHGGIVMKWIDEAAYVCASRYCGKDTVAVFSGGVRFYRPLLIGHVVEVEARLVYTGTKGMHIAVHVRSGDPKGRELNLTTYCLTVMVARDADGNSVPDPAVGAGLRGGQAAARACPRTAGNPRQRPREPAAQPPARAGLSRRRADPDRRPA